MSYRDSLLPSYFDFFIIATFIFVQWRISVRLLRAARERFSGNRRTLARCSIIAFNGLLIFGYAFSFSQLLSLTHAPPAFSMYFGAWALAYLFLATAVITIRAATDFAKKKVDPGRRQALTLAGNALMAAPVIALGYGTFIERFHFRVKEIDVPLGGLAPDLEGLRILQLSDIHLSPFLSEKQFAPGDRRLQRTSPAPGRGHWRSHLVARRSSGCLYTPDRPPSRQCRHFRLYGQS